MSNLLNTMILFGKEFDWTLENALFWLLIVQVALIMFMVVVFAVLLKRVGHNRITLESKQEERTLQSISLDLDMVKRNFALGEEFTCDGLLITAKYNLDPVSEIITDYAVITQEQLDALSKSGTVDGCFVLVPDMSAEGKVTVTVQYQGEQAAYVVAVGDQFAEPVEYTEAVEERTLLGIDLDLGVVQRDFTVGDEFNCDGLVITAKYNFLPKEEVITDYIVIDKETFDSISSEELSGCYVVKPNLAEAGKVAVNVHYFDKHAVYMVVAKEQVVEEEPVETEPVVSERKPVGISLDFSFVQREFTQDDEFNCDGLIVNVNYDAEPLTESIVEYSVVDEQTFGDLAADAEGCYIIKPDLTKVGKQMVSVRYHGLTSYYTIVVAEPKEEEKPERVLLYITVNTDAVKKDFEVGDPFTCDGLVVTAHFNLEPLEADIENYSIVAPDMTTQGSPNVSVQYQDRTVGYRINIAARPVEEKPEETVVVAAEHVQRGPVVVEEESYEGGVLRYDKSFVARYIQSDDEIKLWYTKLKNELLSYKKVKSRLSWKRETYRFGRETVARIGFRGNTMCIFLPLNPADYEDSRFKVEDVSDNISYVDTPCMYRLKNEKRVRLAMQLFATVMEKYGAVRIEREAEDYYLPYEGLVQLIDKGLIKRVIKNKSDEAIFQRDVTSAAEEATAETPAETVVEEVAAETPVDETAVETPAEEPTVEEQPVEAAEELNVEAPVDESAVVEHVEAVEEPVVELEAVEDAQPEEQIAEIPLDTVFEDAPAAKDEPVVELEAAADEVQTDESIKEIPAETVFDDASVAPEKPVAGPEEPVVELEAAEDDSVGEQPEEAAEAVEVVDEQPVKEAEHAEEPATDSQPIETEDANETGDDASDDEDLNNDADASNAQPSEQLRFNGKNRKKHRSHR